MYLVKKKSTLFIFSFFNKKFNKGMNTDKPIISKNEDNTVRNDNK